MPWKQMSVMEQRREFVELAVLGEVSVRELCARFGISRDTGHRLLRRYVEEGDVGLRDRSRRPHSSPSRTNAAMEAAILAVREDHPA